jgi:hypothetical protein
MSAALGGYNEIVVFIFIFPYITFYASQGILASTRKSQDRAGEDQPKEER